MALNFFNACLNLIQQAELSPKLAGTQQLWQQLQTSTENFTWQPHAHIITLPTPGRPALPQLVSPLMVPKRKLTTPNGHASLIHALAHIEFNAINLALDACYRFQSMPIAFYQDWLQVAAEEAYHFQLLNQHLQQLGYTYGDFAAHNGLWEMAHKTEHDVLIRMALVPRVLEARGIDAIPEMQAKLHKIGAVRACTILEIIHRDEIQHVRCGDRWYKYCCTQRQCDPLTTFFELYQQYDAPKIRGAFNPHARLQAGFSPAELEQLLSFSKEDNATPTNSNLA